ncbi:hypothetical protein [Sphingomonas beigongshangi]|uniref:hypothetical protein n=1 Tax=Sphingomonas beigongshangi TaxID=2782540 RepID=UPI001AED6C05|nr:hypothetical protein [Sphingomonas beigongshangi]
MLDDDASGLGVDFVINAGGSFEELARLSAQMDSTEAKVLADANRIEKATANMVNVGQATASVKTFASTAEREMKTATAAIGEVGQAKQALDRILANAVGIASFGPEATRDAANTTRAINATEKAIEGLVRQIERETAATGQTRDERRAAQVEELAMRAVTQGNTDAAERLQTAMRKLQAARDNVAEQKLAATLQAETQAMRERQQAEAVLIDQLRDRARLTAALARTDGSDRPAATSAGATYSALSAKFLADEAREADRAAGEVKRLADEHARLREMVMGSQAAQQADAAAAERMRASTDPLYAITKRLNAEIAESTRLYHAGVTPQAEYVRQQQVLTGALRDVAAQHQAAATAAGKNAFAIKQTAIQLPDIIGGLLTGQKPMQVFIQQGSQIAQIGMMAEGGLKGFAMSLGRVALAFLPFVAAAAVAGVAIDRWMDSVKKGTDLKDYVSTLGLTAKETKNLTDVTVTAGDFMAGAWKTLNDRLGTSGKGKKLIDYLFSPNDAQQVATFISQIYGVFVGGYKGIVATWGLLPAAIGDVVSRAAKAAVVAVEAMINATIDRVNSVIKGANSILGTNLATFGKVKFETPGIDAAVKAYAGAGAKAGAAFATNVNAETGKAMKWMKGVMADIGKNTVNASQKRLKEQADKIIADRDPDKPKVDRHAQALARDAEATEAQIRNLYALADAYKVSDAAALIAEARVKAESQAIKQRADIEAAVDRQVRLSIAQRVSDAAKATAGVRNQADAQAAANAAVAAGLIPADKAAQMVQDQIADLPLLAALQAAQQRGLTDAAERATKALADQRAERERQRKEAQTAQFDVDTKAGANRIAELQMELQLVGATDAARNRALATLRATQEASAKFDDPARQQAYIAQQVEIADRTAGIAQAQRDWNDALTFTADKWDLIARNVQQAAQGMADAFGTVGRSIGDVAAIYTDYAARRERADQIHRAAMVNAGSEAERDRIDAKFALETQTARVGLYGDMAKAAKGFFGENTAGYQAMATAEKAFRALEFALSVKKIAQDAIETGSSIAKSGARTAAHAVEAVVKAISSLPFPLNIAAGAATIAALAGIGVSIVGALSGGGKTNLAPTNSGTGTVLGNSDAKSDSIKNAIDALKEVDTLTNSYARQMAASLKTIESQIGNVASLVVRSGVNDTSGTVTEGFKPNAIGSLLGNIPLIGGFLSSLFGSKTTVLGNGLYGGAQSLGSILSGGFNASAYTDVEKTSKFLGITTSKKTSTQYSAIDPSLAGQFTLILRSFSDAIGAAAGPLGQSTQAIQDRLNGFVVNIGKIDLKGLTGDQIQEKLTAVFGAAADSMAQAAFPGIERFQKVGEGAFETLVRVSSTVEAVTTALDQLGASTRSLGLDAKIGLADHFDNIGDLTNAVGSYFTAFYTKEEQAAAKTQQLTAVFGSLGLTMPATLAAFRQLVEAQDLTTAAGQATYATLLKLAPAFADLKSAMEGAKSAADILSERQDLQRQLLELNGDTAAIRALDLAKLDASNRALQEQVWAVQDAQAAAKAADELRQAWTSVGDSIMDEVKRIRGLTDVGGGNTFAALLGQFNAANEAARGGDQEAAKSLPALSQALLGKAADVATSRQELARIQAQTAAMLEATYGVIGSINANKATSTTAQVAAAADSAGAPAAAAAANDDVAAEIRGLRADVDRMRVENAAGNATIAGGVNKTAKMLEDLTGPNGGDALSVVIAA